MENGKGNGIIYMVPDDADQTLKDFVKELNENPPDNYRPVCQNTLELAIRRDGVDTNENDGLVMEDDLVKEIGDKLFDIILDIPEAIVDGDLVLEDQMEAFFRIMGKSMAEAFQCEFNEIDDNESFAHYAMKIMSSSFISHFQKLKG